MSLTKSQREMLSLAVRSPDGNPWGLISLSQRAGGAKRRMFEEMYEWGWFDHMNRITDAGRAALQTPGATHD